MLHQGRGSGFNRIGPGRYSLVRDWTFGIRRAGPGAALAAALLLFSGCLGPGPEPPPESTPVPPERPSGESAGTASAEGAAGVVHVVEKGQTLWRIARAYHVSVEAVAEANDLEDPTEIEVGQRLLIPGATRVLEVEPYRPDATIAAKTPSELGRGTYIWPLKGSLVSRYGMRNGRRHTGIDIGAPAGAPIRASRAGEVAYAGSGYRGYGKLVILDHGDGDRTYYAHNRELLVRQGEKVRQGELIARCGKTGNASGPHLHFEIRRGSRILDPLDHLP